MSLRRVAVLMFLLVAVLAAAQTDRDGAKDHPMFTRMPNFYIDQFKQEEFGSAEATVTQGAGTATKQLEGHTYFYHYYPKDGAAPVSALQIVRNYTNAAQKIGGKILYDRSFDSGVRHECTLLVNAAGKDVWAMIEARSDNYTLTIAEIQSMRQDVVADAVALANDLRTTGKVAVYGIYFDTGKSDVKPESAPALTEIGKLLKQNPPLKVFIVGHTDMVGDAASNLKLSQARAQSVVTELSTKYGVAATRLTPFGAGPYAPVASNKDEAGRARNRRVELVEIATK